MEGKKTKNLKQLLLIAILKKWKNFLKNDFLVDKKNVSKKKIFQNQYLKKKWTDGTWKNVRRRKR